MTAKYRTLINYCIISALYADLKKKMKKHWLVFIYFFYHSHLRKQISVLFPLGIYSVALLHFTPSAPFKKTKVNKLQFTFMGVHLPSQQIHG